MNGTAMFSFTCFVLVSILAIVNADSAEPCESPQFVVFGETGTIQCNFSAGYFGIFWYNTTDYINEYSVVNLKQSGIDGPGYKSGEFDILPNGSLIITKVTFAHNITFTVVKLDSAFDEVVPHFVTVVVKAFPNPPYPIIGGCEQQKSCVVKIAHQGNLTCSVVGIHPLVELTWETSQRKSSVYLLQTTHHTIRRPDGRFDVHLMSEYYINNTSEYSQSVKCIVVSKEGAPKFDLESKIFLLFPEGNTHPIQPTDKDDVSDAGSNGLLIFLIVFIVLIAMAVILVGAFLVKRGAFTSKDSSLKDEKDAESQLQGMPLLNQQHKSDELIEFISKLKEKYKEVYAATQPLPHIRGKSQKKKKFIESDLQSLNFREGAGKHGTWESVESVEIALQDPGWRSKKLIIEGDHGYIKSTLGVELAYDWCTEKPSSFMKDFEVLIYLQLSQLSDETLTLNSLSPLILGKGATACEKCIEEMYAFSSSVAVLIDSFNYFPFEKGDTTSPDLVKLISHPAFKRFTVILISAPPLLKNVYHFGEIKRIRVSGTNKQTRDKFIATKVATPSTIDTVIEDTSVGLQKNVDNVESSSPLTEETNSAEEDATQREDGETVESKTPLEDEQQEHTKSDEIDKSQEDEEESMGPDTTSKEAYDSSKKGTVQEKQCLIPMDLLVNPYFFAILSQISKKNNSNVEYESITKFFDGLLSYLENETKSEKELGTKPNQQILHKIAFESITFKKEETKFWSKGDISKQMGSKFYESCKTKGYFIEEGVQFNVKSESNDISSPETQVRFSNPFLCEWFAAHHIIHMIDTASSKKGKKEWDDCIKKLVSGGYWYCLRFLCGLNKDVGEKVSKLTKDRHGMHFYCALEANGGIVHTLDTVKKILSKRIHITLKDFKLEVMAILQLLDTGARNQIEIPHLVLEDCFNRPGSSIELVLRSGLELPVLDTLVDLEITEEGRILTEPEANAIVRYALRCNNLKQIKLSKCLLPHNLQEVSFSDDLEQTKLEVRWKPQQKLPSFLLDLQNRQWKNKKGALLTAEEYSDVVKEFHNLR